MIYPWQEPQWQSLLNQQKTGLPHALLLTGSLGLGKLEFVTEISRYLLCENTHKNNSACGDCRGCQLFSAENHPDFFKIMPEENSKIIKIDQLRQLINQLNTTAQRGGYQIAIIYPAEGMNRAAANAFLKTLEEPPGQVLLILVSHQFGIVPVTIRSRCQHIHFSGKNNQTTVNWLQEKIETSQDAELLLRIAEHAPLRALQLAECHYCSLRDNLLQDLIDIRNKNKNSLALASDYLKQDVLLLLYGWMTLMADISRLQLGVMPELLINKDQTQALQSLSHILPVFAVQQFSQRLQQTWQLLNNSSNINIQLLLESLLVNWEELC